MVARHKPPVTGAMRGSMGRTNPDDLDQLVVRGQSKDDGRAALGVAAAAALAGEELVEGVVARGRTLEIPIPNSFVTAGTTEGRDGTLREVTALRCKSYGPGAAVTLPKSEIAWLRSIGTLVDPARGDLPATGMGPDWGRG